MNVLFKVYNKLCVLFCKIKYIIYFNIFLNVLLINYLYYKIWNVLNNKLALALNYTIKLNGCVIIKLIQWLNTNLELLLINSCNYDFLSKLFSRYYEDCPVHQIKYTKDLFLKEFGVEFDDYFELDTSFSIKSGSVAQVYKGLIKANANANANANNVAIKVVHPEIEYQLICPVYFVKIYTYLVTNFKCLYKYDIILDLNAFFSNLKKQINMENEYKNNEYFYNNYCNNNIILIPKPLMKSKNFLVMEFVEGEQFEKIDVSEYKKQILISFMSIFMKDTFINGKYVHCDLHQANWKIYKEINKSNDETDFNYKIIIYDFGYVVENTISDTLKNICYCLDTNNIHGLGNLLFDNIKNINNDISNTSFKDDFIKRYKNHNIMAYPYSDNIITTSINFCYINGYKLNNDLLDFFVSVILLNKHFNKYLFLNYDETCFNEEVYCKYVYDTNMFYMSICEKYDVFSNVKEFLYDTYINNPYFSKRIKYTNTYFNSLKNSSSTSITSSTSSLNHNAIDI
uniref:ABC1 atypical kinase-like domain-containing protein n=1 Tax=viral metagenome TaxID=1070528 RepID=A0A6C0KRH6_9ZZZZ